MRVQGMLVSPDVKADVREVPLAEALSYLDCDRLRPINRGGPPPVGPTNTVMLCETSGVAYPIVDGIPILSLPEALVPPDNERFLDILQDKYAEAYQESNHYNKVAAAELGMMHNSAAFRELAPSMEPTKADKAWFPYPIDRWVGRSAPTSSVARAEAYAHMCPIEGARVLEVGGSGVHSIKMLLAGADSAWLLTPMLQEAVFASALAESAGVASQFSCIVGMAEELPFGRDVFSRVFSGSSIHHTVTPLAFREIARVLSYGGKFAAVEPWRAPLYNLGTRLLGKNSRDKNRIRFLGDEEANVYCQPLTDERISSLNAFPTYTVRHHGAFTRYPLLTLEKFGLSIDLTTAWRIVSLDDRIASRIPRLRDWGSSVSLLANN